jgi:RNA polymerase sigma-70 factor (sigma-E family)
MSTTTEGGIGTVRGQHSDDEQLLIDLYRAHYASLVRLAILLADDNAAAEDLVQDAFVRLHGRWGRLRDPHAALPYLRTCVVNGGRSRLRRLRTVRAFAKHEVARDEASAEQHAVIGETHAELLAAVRALPERQRQVLVLRYYEECSEAETAEVLGISVGAVKSHTHRAIAALGKKLEPTR